MVEIVDGILETPESFSKVISRQSQGVILVVQLEEDPK